MMAIDDHGFLSGPTIYLRAPDLDSDVLNGDWSDWFNDQSNTAYLVHGVFPISAKEEYEYLKEELGKRSNLILAIVQKDGDRLIGVVSLKNIDYINRNAEVAIVTSNKRGRGGDWCV